MDALAFAMVEGVNALGPFVHHFFHGGFGGRGIGDSFFVRRDSRSFASLRMTVLILMMFLFCSRLLEEVPGFAELFEAGTASADVAFGVEAEAGAFWKGVGGDYVPEVEREDVGD